MNAAPEPTFVARQHYGGRSRESPDSRLSRAATPATSAAPASGGEEGCDTVLPPVAGLVGQYGYEEFFGGQVTCPTCRGSGKIPKDLEHELVALIPMSDKRLRPRRTVLYVVLAVLVCMLVGGLFLFFYFPRSVTLQSIQPTLTPTYVDINDSSQISMVVTNEFNVTNDNYFSVHVHSLTVNVLFGGSLIASALNDSTLTVPLRSTRRYYVTFNVSFQDEFVVCSCRLRKGRILLIPFHFPIIHGCKWSTTGKCRPQNVGKTLNYTELQFLSFRAAATFFAYGKESQTTLNTFQYIRCHPADMHDAPPASTTPFVCPPQVPRSPPQVLVLQSELLHWG